MNDSRRFHAQGIVWSATLLVALLLTACTPTPDPLPPNNDAPLLGAGRLQPGDYVSVVFSGVNVPPERFEGRIKEDGAISLPLVGTIQAAGLTIAELENTIRGLYVPKFYHTLNVVVNSESRFYYVQGEVKQPQPVIYRGETTVLSAIASAGGFTDFANKRQVQVTRADGTVITVNCLRALKNPKLDLKVYPLDRIYVPRRWT